MQLVTPKVVTVAATVNKLPYTPSVSLRRDVTEPCRQLSAIIQNTAATFLMLLSRSSKLESFLAVCMLYFV